MSELLYHEKPEEFCISQWQRGPRSIIWLVYRWLLAFFYGIGFIGSVIVLFKRGIWFVYLTHWGIVLCTNACTYSAVLATIYYRKPEYFAPGSWSLKIFWASHFIATVLAMVISVVFWAILFPVSGSLNCLITASDIFKFNMYNLWAHAWNSLGMLLDCFVVAFPTRLTHFILPLAAGTIYAFFTMIYHMAGGLDYFGNPWIYPILDWSHPGPAVASMFGCLVLGVLCSIVVYGIYRLRLLLFKCCRGSHEESS